MVEIESYQILLAIVGGFASVFTQQRIMWNKICKLARIMKRLHPKESKIEGL